MPCVGRPLPRLLGPDSGPRGISPDPGENRGRKSLGCERAPTTKARLDGGPSSFPLAADGMPLAFIHSALYTASCRAQ